MPVKWRVYSTNIWCLHTTTWNADFIWWRKFSNVRIIFCTIVIAVLKGSFGDCELPSRRKKKLKTISSDETCWQAHHFATKFFFVWEEAPFPSIATLITNVALLALSILNDGVEETALSFQYLISWYQYVQMGTKSCQWNSYFNIKWQILASKQVLTG